MEVLTDNKKCMAILQSARKLFWKHGFRRVTIDEICRDAKTSKMTFYRFFPDKIELAKTVLDQFYDDSMIKFRKIIRDDTSVAIKMKKMIEMKMAGSNNLSKEFIQDFLLSAHLGLKSYFEEKNRIVWEEGVKEFKRGQEEGWIRKDLNVEFLFQFSMSIIPVLYEKQMMDLFDSPQGMINEISNLIIYGIAPRQE